MGCNCKCVEIILAIVILLFLFWETTASTWIIAIAAILLLIHALSCKKCGIGMSAAMPAKPARRTTRRTARRRRR